MMRLRYTGQFDMPIRHRVFAPGSVTLFDMDDLADAALAEKCARLVQWFEPVTDEAPEPPKRRGRPPKVKPDGEDEA